jgi:glycosyltransferase involved in cell wall biosynthesis
MNQIVSIIVPVYNVEKYIDECIISLINQSYSNIEIVLIDDGSSDNSGLICDKYTNIDSRVKVYHNSNRGRVYSRKFGFDHSNGELVLFVDSDDWVEKDYVRTLINGINNDNCDMAICSYFENSSIQKIHMVSFDEGFYSCSKMHAEILPNLIINDKRKVYILPSLCNKIYKRIILSKVLEITPGDITFGEDGCITYPYILRCKSIYIISNPLYHYRQNQESMTKSYNKKQTLDSIKLIAYLRNTIDCCESLHYQINDYQEFIYIANITNCAKAGFSSGYNSRCNEIVNFINETNFKDTIKESQYSIFNLKRNIYFYIFLSKSGVRILLCAKIILNFIKNHLLRKRTI